VHFRNRVVSVKTGRRGRPRKQIDPETLAHDFGPGHSTSISGMARLLGVDRKTLRNISLGEDIDLSYNTLTPDELDTRIRNYFETRPDSGYPYCHGYLRSLGLRVRRCDVQASMSRVRPLAGLVRDSNPVIRRSYRVSRPNAVWHGDGYHKLIRYGIVIHGFIDGYCRTVRNFQTNSTLCLTFTSHHRRLLE
jgi:hypothetical protein